MIEKETVFVLGAGASEPYDLPLGSELREEIIKGFQPHGELRGMFAGMEVVTPAAEKLDDFARRLDDTPTASIDSFIRKNTTFDFIARCAITATLLHHEDGGLLKAAGDWYRDLFEFMEKADDFGDNKLRVVTFNYDRSFEEYFTRGLAAQNEDWEWGDFDAAKKKVKPLHIHGCMGMDMDMDLLYGGGRGGGTPAPMLIQHAAKGLKILATDPKAAPAYDEARALLETAEVICFLGFAYHRDNMNRLMPKKLRKGVQIFGTTYKMAARDVRYPKGHLERLAREAGGSALVDLRPVNCRKLLAEHVTY